MFEFIKEWFTKLVQTEPKEPVFDYTLYPKEDMNKYTFGKDAEDRMRIVKCACTPLLFAIAADKKVCIDFTGGAYGSSFLRKMAYEIAEETFKWYSQKNIGRAVPRSALRNITVLNSEDPSIVDEFIEYLEKAEEVYTGAYYGVIA